MFRLAFGQSKMLDKPVVGLLHLIVYVAFILINIELIEIIIDVLFGTHRFLAPYLGGFYNFLIGFFEILALLVIISVLIFWIRRNMQHHYKLLITKKRTYNLDYFITKVVNLFL